MIHFKAKKRQVLDVNNNIIYEYIPVPTLTTRHCDMAKFRVHPKFAALANSDLFPGVLARIQQDLFPGKKLKLNQPLPPNVTIDDTNFLVEVRVTSL